MVDPGSKSHPTRLEPDAILEALVEVRFDTAEPAEIIVGRLSDAALFENYKHARMPIADVPQPVRDADPTLRYQPIIEISRDDGLRVARLGGRVLSYHIVNQYPGWDVFRREIAGVINHVHAKIKTQGFVRVGFRYVNVFTPGKHAISGIEDTNLSITLAGERVLSPINLNYTKLHEDMAATVRVATPGFVEGPLPADFSLLCDIDVFTPENHRCGDVSEFMAWIERAHALEKDEFFGLLPASVIARLTAKKD